MKIDFVSDVSCPWCAIGLAALDQAIDRLGPEADVHLHFQPFELNPQMAAEGEEIVEHLARKYRMAPAQVDANRTAIRERGAALGFEFRMDRRDRIYNTFDAHRLLHWAGLQSPTAQHALKQALLKAYFTEGRNPSATEVLLQAATEAGLDPVRAAEVLASNDHADAVREAEQFWQQQGIQSVPSIIVNDRYLIQGGQPVEAFEQALRQIAAEG
jgi:predicted DsbA family dithiol-disulfide isomerase